MNLDVLMSACRQSGGERVAGVIDLWNVLTIRKITRRKDTNTVEFSSPNA